MTKQEKIKEGMKEILAEDLINLNSTHENAPPHKDCGEECGVSIDDQIVAANPILSPMRSDGKKHKKCMDCWNEYIDDLILRIEQKQDSQGVVIKVDKFGLPDTPSKRDGYAVYWRCYQLAQQDMLKAGYAAVEPLI